MFKHITTVIKELWRDSKRHNTPISNLVVPGQTSDTLELPDGMMDSYFWDGFTWIESHPVSPSKPKVSSTP